MVDFELPSLSEQETKRALKLKTEQNQIISAIAGAFVGAAWYAVDYILIPDQRWSLLLCRIGLLALPLLICALRRPLKVSGKMCLYFTTVLTTIMIAYVLNSVPHGVFHTYVFGYALMFIGVGALAIWERLYSILLLVFSVLINVVFFYYLSPLENTTFLAEALFPIIACAIISSLMIDNRRTIQLKEIRHRLEIEQSQKILEEQKDKLSSELDNFVYSVSHDLRSPLLSVKGILTLVFDSGKIDPDAEQYLRMAETSIDRLDSTIQDILEYSRNSRLDVKPEWFDMKVVVSQIFEDIQFISENPIHFDIEIEGDTQVCSDKSRIATVIKNLASNAAKYRKLNSSDCFVRFRMWRDGNRICMEISDNGIGIPSNQLDNVFKMFYRVSADRVGTGLGLFIVQEITRKLDGALQLKSEVGVGTSVLIQFEQSAITPKQTV